MGLVGFRGLGMRWKGFWGRGVGNGEVGVLGGAEYSRIACSARIEINNVPIYILVRVRHLEF